MSIENDLLKMQNRSNNVTGSSICLMMDNMIFLLETYTFKRGGVEKFPAEIEMVG
ncbi:hypothetical protein HNV12_09165 [Methanococcoides sp. SA1]|nr:hypothetical protein [Methanococcoides sp. SA1]